MFFNAFEKVIKIEPNVGEAGYASRGDRVIDIADVSASQGALHYGYAMPVMPAGETALWTSQKSQTSRQTAGHCTIDIVDVFGRVPSPTG